MMRVSGSQFPAERIRAGYGDLFSKSLDATNYIPAGAMADGERLEGGRVVSGQVKFVFRGVYDGS